MLFGTTDSDFWPYDTFTADATQMAVGAWDIDITAEEVEKLRLSTLDKVKHWADNIPGGNPRKQKKAATMAIAELVVFVSGYDAYRCQTTFANCFNMQDKLHADAYTDLSTLFQQKQLRDQTSLDEPKAKKQKLFTPVPAGAVDALKHFWEIGKTTMRGWEEGQVNEGVATLMKCNIGTDNYLLKDTYTLMPFPPMSGQKKQEPVTKILRFMINCVKAADHDAYKLASLLGCLIACEGVNPMVSTAAADLCGRMHLSAIMSQAMTPLCPKMVDLVNSKKPLSQGYDYSDDMEQLIAGGSIGKGADYFNFS